MMTAEVNAAVEGALAGGADRIIVNDSHGLQTNILIEYLNPAAELISGVPKPFGMMQGIGSNIDVVFLVGYHALAGTGAGILAHSWSREVASIQLNDLLVGETGLNAALGGAFGAPVVLVTGDRAVTVEAKNLLGDIETVVTKEGISGTAAQCLHPQKVQEWIRQAAKRAVSVQIAPFKLSSPITLRVTFSNPVLADMASLVPSSRRMSGCAVEWAGEDMPSVYHAFQAMVCLSMLIKLIE